MKFENDTDTYCYFTQSNTLKGGENITSKTILGTNSSVGAVTLSDSNKKITVSDIKNASYSVKLTSDLFQVDREGFAYITFKLDNGLDKFDTNGVSAYICDVSGTPNVISAPVKITKKDGTVFYRDPAAVLDSGVISKVWCSNGTVLAINPNWWLQNLYR